MRNVEEDIFMRLGDRRRPLLVRESLLWLRLDRLSLPR